MTQQTEEKEFNEHLEEMEKLENFINLKNMNVEVERRHLRANLIELRQDCEPAISCSRRTLLIWICEFQELMRFYAFSLLFGAVFRKKMDAEFRVEKRT